MKKLLKCFSLAAAALMLFAGCSGLTGADATVDSKNYDGICSLAISVNTTGAENTAGTAYSIVKGAGAARTISPTSLEGQEASLTYTLKGTSVTTGATLGTDGAGFVLGGEKAPEGTGTNAGKYMAEIPYGAWELTLEAKDSSGKLVLMGKSYANLKTSRSEITFTLTTEDVTTPGGVALSGSYTDAEGAAKSYKAGLYDLVTGELKYPATESAADTTDAKTFAFSATSVLPGRYSFQIRFYNDEMANQATARQIGYWEDLVVVAPGRLTKKTTIDCGKINQSPASPENLRVYLIDDSEEADGYTVILTWDDNSNNEENFIITIKDYSTGAAGEVYKILGVEAADPADADDKREVFYGSSMNAGGSIRASSTTASIKLPYGKLFDFEIQAQNFVGTSKVSATVEASPRIATAVTTGGPSDATFIDAARVNRFTIDYFLNGGALSLAGTPYNGTNYVKYASIYDYADDTAKVLNTVLNGKLTIDNATSGANHLVKGSSKFIGWVKADGTAIANTDIITFEGVAVKATYDDSTAVSYSIDDDYYEITATALYGTGTDDVKNTAVNVTSNEAFTISAAVSGANAPATLTVESIKVKITAPNGSTAASSGKVTGSGSSAPEYVWNVNGADSGIYKVSVIAELSDNKKYEMTFELELER